MVICWTAEKWDSQVQRFGALSVQCTVSFLWALLCFANSPLSPLGPSNGTDMCQNVQKWVGAQCKCSSRASETQQQSNREWDCKSSVRVQRQHCILREGSLPHPPLSELPSGTEVEGVCVLMMVRLTHRVDILIGKRGHERRDASIVMICSFDSVSVSSSNIYKSCSFQLKYQKLQSAGEKQNNSRGMWSYDSGSTSFFSR